MLNIFQKLFGKLHRSISRWKKIFLSIIPQKRLADMITSKGCIRVVKVASFWGILKYILNWRKLVLQKTRAKTGEKSSVNERMK